MSRFTIATTDSCTLTTKAGNLDELKPGTKLRIQVGSNKPFDAVSGYSTKWQLCLQKGSPGAKQLHTELQPGFVKGQTQEVTVEVIE